MHCNNVFLLKADIAVADGVLRALSAERDRQAIERLPEVSIISKHLFGKLPSKCEVISEGGTFCLIYKLSYADNNTILKLALDFPGCSLSGFDKQVLLHGFLLEHKISVPTIYAANVTTYGPSKYLAMSFIEGESYHQLADTPDKLNLVVKELGHQLALLHQLHTDGCGEILLDSSDVKKIKATQPDWQAFILTRLDEHLSVCRKNNYLTASDCENSRAIFSALSGEICLIEPRLLHCDLGSKNIIVKSDGSICILDWEDAIGGDPIFDIAMWGSFMLNQDKLDRFLAGYYWNTMQPYDFQLKYYLYQYRILLAKTVHRFRFQYSQNDRTSPTYRLLQGLNQLKRAIA
jgi:fructosamine-3-kinase